MTTTEVCTVEVDDLEGVRRFCIALASQIQIGELVLLSGEMAAGKTTFVQELTRALGSIDIASSPTYAIAQFYETSSGTSLIHIDTYRLKSIAEFFDSGLQDYFEEAIVFVEWGEMLENFFDSYWHLHLQRSDKSESARTVRLAVKGGNLSSRAEEFVRIIRGPNING